MFAFMKKGAMFGLFLLISMVSIGQTAFNQQVDTVKSVHRSGGLLDTLSNNTKSFQSTFFVSPNAVLLSPFQVYAINGSSLHSFKVKENALLFSAIPHLGFFYAFGAQGAQRLKVDFQEAFKHGILLNVNFDKTKGNGFLRNDDFSVQQFNGHLLRTGNRYSFDLNVGNQAVDRSWSNGLLSPFTIPGVDLDLQAVQKENAHSTQSFSFIRGQHRFDFNRDSTLGFGLLLRHEFGESKRYFEEFGDLTQLYQNVYWNADTTQDRFRERSFTNDLGIFFERHSFQLQSALSYRMRNWFDNVSSHDTTEIWWKNDFSYRSTKFEIEHHNAFNLFGAANGMTSVSKVILPFSFMQLHIGHQLSASLPELMQRNYFSNNVQYQMSSLENQWNQSLSLTALKKMGEFQMEAAYRLLQFRKVYIFDNSAGTWRNDQLASDGFGQSLQASVNWTHKGFQIKPGYTWTHFSTDLNFQPKHQTSIHMQWKGGVFKAKKLRMLFAADASYLSSYQQRSFIPQMGVLNLVETSLLTQDGFMNLAFTTALEVETFRFFIRVDNLGSFWVDPNTSFVSNYVFPSMQIKIGLTWYFWN